MPDDPQRFHRAFALIDAANGEDPNHVEADGRLYPAQLLYAMRMTACLDRLEPAASESLRLAVRCQHLRRWMIPRSTYPMDRAGYHRWRTDLARFHADEAARLLHEAGYDASTIARVQSLVRKEQLNSEPEAQTLEDVACLVFLENDLVPFAAGHDEQKVVQILRKTWKKMSERGHRAAEGIVSQLPEEARLLVRRALTPADL